MIIIYFDVQIVPNVINRIPLWLTLTIRIPVDMIPSFLNSSLLSGTNRHFGLVFYFSYLSPEVKDFFFLRLAENGT